MKLDKGKAFVVLSGGQDSTTCLFWARQRFSHVRAICFDYGQKHFIEIESARSVARLAGVSLQILSFKDGFLKSTSPLVDHQADLPTYNSFREMEDEVGDKVEKTFVPMRNTMFLTLAANHAIAAGYGTVVTGVCEEDNANYPDCTSAFISKLEAAFNESLGLSEGLQIATPLMHMTKAQTCKLAYSMSDCWIALAHTHTSYDGKYPPTGKNHSNILRANGFLQANLPDPLIVRAWNSGLMELPPSYNYSAVRALFSANKQTSLKELIYAVPEDYCNDVLVEPAEQFKKYQRLIRLAENFVGLVDAGYMPKNHQVYDEFKTILENK